MPTDQDARALDAEERHAYGDENPGHDFPSDRARHAGEDSLAVGDVADHDALPLVTIMVTASRKNMSYALGRITRIAG
jgi:hypothetical protein